MVFERFHRLDEDRSRDKGGFGLGLNIAREIARAHRGDIELRTSRDDWTEFALVLPTHWELSDARDETVKSF